MGRGRVPHPPPGGISDDLAARNPRPFVDLLRPVIEVRVVKAVDARIIKFVNRQSSSAADEDLADDAVGDRTNRRAARSHDVDSLMTMPAANLVEGIMQLRRL